MADRLEQRLAALAAEVEFPPTPDLAPAVAARVGQAAPRGARMRPARRSLALALGGAGAACRRAPGRSRRVRDAVGDLLGLDGATVERVPRLPASPGGLELGRPVTLTQAREGAAFRLRVPHDAATRARPTRCTFAATAGWRRPRLLYRPRAACRRRRGGRGWPADPVPRRPRARPGREVHRPGHRHRRVRVGSATGFWIEGPHSFAYRDAGGVDAHRRAAPRLGKHPALGRGPVLLRLESELPLRRALEVARTVR